MYDHKRILCVRGNLRRYCIRTYIHTKKHTYKNIVDHTHTLPKIYHIRKHTYTYIYIDMTRTHTDSKNVLIA